MTRRFVVPFQGDKFDPAHFPRALPWANLFGPLRGIQERNFNTDHVDDIASGECPAFRLYSGKRRFAKVVSGFFEIIADFVPQPGPGERPIAIGGGPRQPEMFAGVFNRQAAEGV